MDFLNDNKTTFNIDYQYHEYYELIHQATNLEFSDIFYIMLLIGFKNNQKEILTTPYTTISASYLSETQRCVIYTITQEITKNALFQKIDDQNLIKNAIIELNSYANGGMKLLINKQLSSIAKLRKNNDISTKLMYFLFGESQF